MTSWQEPPLTRREMRERERLLAQQAESATADAVSAPGRPAASPAPQPAFRSAPVSHPAPVARPVYVPQQAAIPPVAPAPPPQASPPAAPHPPGYGAGWSPGGYGDQATAFGGAIASPAPSNPFAPRPEPVAPTPPPQAALPAPAPPEPATPERTLTRRELRAMLEAHSGDGLDEFDLDDAAVERAPAPAAPQQVAAPPRQVAPILPQAAPIPPQPTPSQAPAPHRMAEPALADETPAVPKQVGHWTDQLDAPIERAEPFDQLLSRGGVSHGVPTTTNALILPTLPDHSPMGNSLAPSGEVIVTGSIDLPRSFGATGVHPGHVDSSDVDRLFDQVEDGVGVGVPVSATRAISTQSSSRAMMAPPKKEGMNVPLVLAVTAGVLALGVVGTLIIGAVSGLL